MSPAVTASKKTAATPEWYKIARPFRKELKRIKKRGLNHQGMIHTYLTRLEWAYPNKQGVPKRAYKRHLKIKGEAHERLFKYLRRNEHLISDFMLNIVCALDINSSPALVSILNLAAEKKPDAFTYASLRRAAERPALQPYVAVILGSNPDLVHDKGEEAPEKSLVKGIFSHIVSAPDSDARQKFRCGALAAVNKVVPEIITSERLHDHIEDMKKTFLVAAPDAALESALKECLAITTCDILRGRNDLIITWKARAPKEWVTLIPANLNLKTPAKRAGTCACSPAHGMAATLMPPQIPEAQRPKHSHPAQGGAGRLMGSRRGRHPV